MTVQMSPICMFCKHFHKSNLDGETCDAYPNGIPEEILDNKVDHRTPYKDDKGVVFSAEKPLPKYIESALDAPN